MRPRRSAALLLLALTASCVDRLPVAPDPAIARATAPGSVPDVRFSEIHYDNVGTDAGEAIEISAPAGTNLAGYSIVLYNGNGGAAYDTKTLSGTIPATCGTRGVFVQTYPQDGVQNGSPDGMALIGPGNQVIEFLSYEGTFKAVGGPATNLTSVDIGVTEPGNVAAGQSLQRNSDGTWNSQAASTFGACNDNSTTTPPAPVVASVVVTPVNPSIVAGATQAFTAAAFDASSQPITGVVFTWSSATTAAATINATSGVATGVAAGSTVITATAPNNVSGTTTLAVTAAGPVNPTLPDTRFSEIHYDNTGTDAGEAIEIEGPVGTNITGWSIVLYDGNGGVVYGTPSLTFTGTIGASCSTGTRGVAVLNYPVNGIQNGSPDGMALVDAQSHVIEFLSYEGSFLATNGPAAGMTSTDILVSEPGTGPLATSLSRKADGTWLPPAAASFGTCNSDGGTATPPAGGSISFSGRSASADPPLPVGFQSQLFTTVKDENNTTITPVITWSSDTPLLASIDQRGVITALGAGTAVFRATTPTGLTATYPLPFVVGTTGTASYVGNAAFGEPTDNDPSDDFILRRAEFTASYSKIRNTPNWVAYEIDPSDFGGQDRCNCFTFDPDLPASFTRYNTADYTGAGAFAGYGIDRGHLARSFDRTSGNLDNAHVFYFSNIVPQAAALNQGPWADMENDLGDLARTGGKEVYVITGVAGNIGTIKGEGLITIPEYTWKVAVVMPHDKGLADVHQGTDLEVIAAVMPNSPNVASNWNQYRVTVDSVEKLSGYDLLALLPDNIETQIEAGNHFPVPNALTTYSASEGATVSFSGSATDVDAGDVLTYAWDFGDGTTATGAQALHIFQNSGVYTVTLTVADQKGAATSTTTTATIANVAPTLTLTSPAVWHATVSSSLAINFTDPNTKDSPFVVRINWGDGSAITTFSSAILPLIPFTRPHVYAAPGTYQAVVTVTDRDGGVGTKIQSVTVQP